LDVSPLRQRRSDPLEPLLYGFTGLIEPDVGEVDRQERVLRGLIEPARQGDIVITNSVGLDWVGDALPEEVDRAREPLGGEAMREGERVLESRPGGARR
jgi:hypothetical protein